MTLTRAAPAKINLTLEILARRPDGFHEIRSVMQAVSLHDTLTFRDAPPGVLTLEGGSADAPPNEDNLVLKAARAMQMETNGRHGAALTLEKRIPVGAGLGGGSSDAAATLLGLNALWRTGISRERLFAIAADLGSDVPFFLTMGTALAGGRGERLTPAPPAPRLWLALVQPPAFLRTPDVYREHARLATYGPARKNASREMLEALRRCSDAQGIHAVAASLHNDLEDAAARLCPEVSALREQLLECGAVGALLSGSGSAVFGLAGSEAEARRLCSAASRAAWTAVAHAVSLPWEGEV